MKASSSLHITAARLALTALTFVSLSLRSAPEDAAASALLPGAALWALGLYALWRLYGAWLKLPHPLSGLRYWLLSAILAGIYTLGQSFSAFGTAEGLSGDKAGALCFFAGRVPLLFAMIRLLFAALTAPERSSDAKRPPASVKPLSPKYLTAAASAALFICWLPWYYFTFPGVVSTDSITQLMELYGLTPLSNANPVFQTALIDIFRRVGLALGGPDTAIALYCVVQALLMAWLLGSLMADMAHSAAPRALRIGTFAFCAFCPVFPLFAFCVGKDTNFAMAALWLSLSAWRLIRLKRSERPGAPLIVSLCLSSALCTLLRNPGVYLALFTLSVLLIQSLPGEKKHWRIPALALGTTIMLFLSLHLLLLPTLQIAPMPETENYSLPLQQVARVAASCELTPEEKNALDGVLDVSKLKSAYNGELSDPVKALWRPDAAEEQKRAFWQTWLHLITKHPATCFSATFHNAYGYLCPGCMSRIKPTLLIGDQTGKLSNVKGTFDYSVNPLSGRLKDFTDSLALNPLYRALTAPGLYGCIALFALFVLMKKGRRAALPAALPALLTLAGNLLSAVNAYFRYAMPLYLCAPLLLWLCAAATAQAEERPLVTPQQKTESPRPRRGGNRVKGEAF